MNKVSEDLEYFCILGQEEDWQTRQELKNKILEFISAEFGSGLMGILEKPEDEVYFISKYLLTFLGYTYKEFLEECKGKFINCVLEEDKQIIADSKVPEIEEGEFCELVFRIVKKNGEIAWVSQRNKKVSLNNGKVVYISMTTDITISKKLMDKLMSTDYDCIYSIDAIKDEYTMISIAKGKKGVFRGIGRNYSKGIVNFAKDYIKEEDVERFIEETKIGNMCQMLENNDEYVTYYGFKGENGKILRKKFKCTYIDEKEKIILFTRTDITDVYEQEEIKNSTLREALRIAEEANYAKTAFLSRMSHDIRTPLNAIVGMSKIAEMRINDREGIEECLEKINSSSEYLLKLINDILDMSKIESGKMFLNKDEFDFSSLIKNIESIIYPQAAKKCLNFQIKVQPDLEKYYIGDALRINQIIMNLLSNALKFTPANGNILFEVREKSKSEESAQMEFIIEDNGIGMSEEFQKRMFEPFEQDGIGVSRNNAGTGLGLAIVHSLVKLMDGNLKVNSKKRQGTKFVVTLNLNFTKQSIEKFLNQKECYKKNLNNKKYCFKGQKILLVEDNSINMEIAKTFLELEGFDVDKAFNGRMAVDMYLLSDVNYYKAILMDIRMPEMNGLEATKAIRNMEREDAAKIPIIALSANAFESDISEAKYAGMDDYLIKPLDPEKMYRVLGEFIFGKRQ